MAQVQKVEVKIDANQIDRITKKLDLIKAEFTNINRSLMAMKESFDKLIEEEEAENGSS
jgi:hypothetical protein